MGLFQGCAVFSYYKASSKISFWHDFNNYAFFILKKKFKQPSLISFVNNIDPLTGYPEIDIGNLP